MSSPVVKLFIFAAILAFVGVVAGVKMQQKLWQPVADGPSGTEYPAALVVPKTIDPSFYEGMPAPTTTVQAITATVRSLMPKDTAAYQMPSAYISSAAPVVPAVPADAVSAESYLVGDVTTGKIYLSKNSVAILPAASMSKLLNAITATNMYSATTTIEITPAETAVPPDPSNLIAGERFTAKELLYPLLLDSSNVAAEALASSTGRIKFLSLMSSYAWEIGMSGAFFADPSGLSEYDEGSANGFFMLAQYLYKSRLDILTLTRLVSVSVATTTDHGAHIFASIHPFVTDPRFLGGKTGHTPAAEDTMLTIMNIKGHPIAFIVLRSLNRARDTQLLITKVEGMI